MFGLPLPSTIYDGLSVWDAPPFIGKAFNHLTMSSSKEVTIIRGITRYSRLCVAQRARSSIVFACLSMPPMCSPVEHMCASAPRCSSSPSSSNSLSPWKSVIFIPVSLHAFLMFAPQRSVILLIVLKFKNCERECTKGNLVDKHDVKL